MTDMPTFTFDVSIHDNDNQLRIDVTRDEHDFLLLNIQPLDFPWPRTTVVVSLKAAAQLAQALLDAVAIELSETTAE